MTLFERLRYRLSALRAAIQIGPTPSVLKVAWTMPRVAGASEGDGTEGKDEKDQVTMSKAEADQLRRKAAEGDKSSRKLEAKVADLEAKLEDADAGTDEVAKLTKQVERLTARAERAEQEKADLEGEIESGKRQATVTAVAKRLGLRNPEIASKLISNDDQADEGAAEKAIKALLKSEPYLKSPSQGQRDVTGSNVGEEPDGKGDPKTETSALTGESRMAAAYGSTETKE